MVEDPDNEVSAGVVDGTVDGTGEALSEVTGDQSK